MSMRKLKYLFLASLMALTLGTVSADDALSKLRATDTLYIGNSGLNSVAKFNANTNDYLGAIQGAECYGPDGAFAGFADGVWSAKTSGPCQAFGMFIKAGSLFVANGNNGVYLENSNQVNVSGDVMQFLVGNGRLKKKLVSPTDRSGNINVNAPYSPRGALFYRGKIYVADMAEFDPNDPTADCDGYYAGACKSGSIKIYNPGNGRLIGKMAPDSTFGHVFHPRGIVIKNGLLYAAVRKLPGEDSADPNGRSGGWVLRFDLATGKFKDVFISSDGSCHPPTPADANWTRSDCADPSDQLDRPEGIVFGPDGNIYITSFRYDVEPSDGGNDNDKIMIFDGVTGAYADQIDLAGPQNTSGQRAFAQALLFGPKGRLIVPITSGTEDVGGEVRSYDVGNSSYPYHVIIPAYASGGPLIGGWNLTYGKTDPATLEYTK